MQRWDEVKTALTFSDINLIPCDEPCTIRSRNEEIDLTTQFTRNYKIKIPIIASPMDTICDSRMAIAMYKLGGAGIIHRFMSIKDQVEHVKKLVNNIDPDDINAVICAAIGIKGDFLERATELVNHGVNILFLDTAHGNHILTKEAMISLKKSLPKYVDIVPGNVAHINGALNLASWGADAIRVGIGNGCFVSGTKVKTSNNLKNIEDIVVGDKVYTHTGELKTVIDTLSFYHHKELVEINGIRSTPNHEYYVIHKSDCDKVNENNVHEYAKWIQAIDLTDEYFLIEI